MTGEETEALRRAYERYALTESMKWKFFVKESLTPSNNPWIATNNDFSRTNLSSLKI